MSKTEEKIKLEIEYLFEQGYADWSKESINRTKHSCKKYRANIKNISHFEMIDTGDTINRIMYIETKKNYYVVFLDAQSYHPGMHLYFKLVEFPSKEALKHLAKNIKKYIY